MAGTVTNKPLSQYSGDVSSTMFYRPDIKDWLAKLNRQDTPLITLTSMAPAPAKTALKLEWGWGNVVPNYDTLAAAITDTTGTLVTVTNVDMWAVADKFRIDSESFEVTAVDSTNSRLTVAPRAFDGSTAATHLNGVGITRMSSATRENQFTPLSPIAQGELDYNYFQQREYSIQISHRADVIPTYESIGLGRKVSKAETEIQKKMNTEIPVLIEQDMLFGQRFLGDTGTASSMGGLLTTTSYITYRNTSLSGPLKELDLLDQFQTVYSRVGLENSGKTWMAHPKVLRIISSFYNGGRRLTSTESKIGLGITEIDTGWFGTVKLVPNYLMVQSDAAGGTSALNQIVAFNPADIKRCPLTSDSEWSMGELPEEGWFKRLYLRTDQTMTAVNPDSRFLLGGFSVSSSDYAGLA